MALSKLNDDVNVIAKLPDEPNDVGGLSAAELKAKFDEAAVKIKAFLNEVHVAELDGLIADINSTLGNLQLQIDNLVAISLPDGSVTEAKLADQSVSHRALGLNAVETANIKNGAVGNTELAENAVGASKIQNDAVTKDKIAPKSVGYEELTADAVFTANIKDKNVTAEKIADNAIGKNKLAANAVETAKIADNAVTAGKITAGAVSTLRTITLNSGGWSASGNVFTQTANVSGLSANSQVVVDIDCSAIADAELEDYNDAWSNILKATSGNGTIKFFAKEALAKTVTVKVLEVRK